jgi:DNA-binding MarR family transcriptional regulator
MKDSRNERLDELTERFEVAVMRVGREIGHRSVAAMGTDLTGPQYHIMRCLARGSAPKGGDIAGMLRIQPSAVTAMVDRLVSRGYVERERDRQDRRVVHIRATSAGLEALGLVEGAVRDYVRGMLAKLDEDEVDSLVRIYEKLAEAADVDADAAGHCDAAECAKGAATATVGGQPPAR